MVEIHHRDCCNAPSRLLKETIAIVDRRGLIGGPFTKSSVISCLLFCTDSDNFPSEELRGGEGRRFSGWERDGFGSFYQKMGGAAKKSVKKLDTFGVKNAKSGFFEYQVVFLGFIFVGERMTARSWSL